MFCIVKVKVILAEHLKFLFFMLPNAVVNTSIYLALNSILTSSDCLEAIFRVWTVFAVAKTLLSVLINSTSILSNGSSKGKLFFIFRSTSKVISLKVILEIEAFFTFISGLFSSIYSLVISFAVFCNVSHEDNTNNKDIKTIDIFLIFLIEWTSLILICYRTKNLSILDYI